jgi:glycolate oxidase
LFDAIRQNYGGLYRINSKDIRPLLRKFDTNLLKRNASDSSKLKVNEFLLDILAGQTATADYDAITPKSIIVADNRKNAFPAAGRISPDYYCMDGTIPRKNLGRMLVAISEMENTYQLRCMNVFHAGDGNLHPLILFDANKPGEWERADRFGADILELCVELGGTVEALVRTPL